MDYALSLLPFIAEVQIMRFISNKIVGTTVALLLASSSASAAIVTSWDYSVSSVFTSATYNGAGGTVPGAGVGALFWGSSTGFGQSSLVVGGSPAGGAVDTYLGLIPPATAPYLGLSTSLTHNNNPITGTSLTSAVLTNTVVLTPTAPSGPASNQSVPFNIAFTETPNAGTCAVSGSPTACNDIFVLTGGLTNFSFTYDAVDYYVNIFPTTGGVLSILEDTACGAAGQPDNCVGFSTPENQSTTLAFGFTISTQPLQQVPEPGILALFGIGLIGLFARRRRAS